MNPIHEMINKNLTSRHFEENFPNYFFIKEYIKIFYELTLKKDQKSADNVLTIIQYLIGNFLKEDRCIYQLDEALFNLVKSINNEELIYIVGNLYFSAGVKWGRGIHSLTESLIGDKNWKEYSDDLRNWAKCNDEEKKLFVFSVFTKTKLDEINLPALKALNYAERTFNIGKVKYSSSWLFYSKLEEVYSTPKWIDNKFTTDLEKAKNVLLEGIEKTNNFNLIQQYFQLTGTIYGLGLDLSVFNRTVNTQKSFFTNNYAIYNSIFKKYNFNLINLHEFFLINTRRYSKTFKNSLVINDLLLKKVLESIFDIQQVDFTKTSVEPKCTIDFINLFVKLNSLTGHAELYDKILYKFTKFIIPHCLYPFRDAAPYNYSANIKEVPEYLIKKEFILNDMNELLKFMAVSSCIEGYNILDYCYIKADSDDSISVHLLLGFSLLKIGMFDFESLSKFVTICDDFIHIVESPSLNLPSHIIEMYEKIFIDMYKEKGINIESEFNQTIEITRFYRHLKFYCLYKEGRFRDKRKDSCVSGYTWLYGEMNPTMQINMDNEFKVYHLQKAYFSLYKIYSLNFSVFIEKYESRKESMILREIFNILSIMNKVSDSLELKYA